MLFINNNNVNCCFQKTFLFQKLDSNATILGLKKTAPLQEAVYSNGSVLKVYLITRNPYTLSPSFSNCGPKGC